MSRRLYPHLLYLCAFGVPVFASGVALAADQVESPAKIDDVKRRLVGEWRPDLELTTEYGRKRLKHDSFEASKGPLWGRHSKAAWVFTDRDMNQVRVDTSEVTGRPRPYIVAGDAKGFFYIITLKGERYGDSFRIEFYKDALVLIFHLNPTAETCLAYVKQSKDESAERTPSRTSGK